MAFIDNLFYMRAIEMAIDPNKQKVIDALNKARAMELQAIHQYMIQHYLLAEWDFGQLCAYIKLIAIDEMRHAEDFAEHIDKLGGEPVCDNAGPIVQNQPVDKIFAYNTTLETDTIATYNKLAEICHEAGDLGAVGLFGDIIKQESVHLEYYESTQKHIKELGDAFLAKYAATSKHTGPIKSFVKLMEKEKF